MSDFFYIYRVAKSNDNICMYRYKVCPATFSLDYHAINRPSYINVNIGELWYKEGKPHRDDGPYFISYERQQFDSLIHWAVNGLNLDDQVDHWMEQNLLPKDWKNWTEEEKTLFQLLVCNV